MVRKDVREERNDSTVTYPVFYVPFLSITGRVCMRVWEGSWNGRLSMSRKKIRNPCAMGWAQKFHVLHLNTRECVNVFFFASAKV